MTLVHDVLFVAWRSERTSTIHPVGRLLRCERHPGPFWEYAYVQGVREAEADGFAPSPEFSRIDSVYGSLNLFPLFQNRTMPASRPDYADHVGRVGLPVHASEPLLILSRTGGRRPTDKIEVFGLPAFDPRLDAFVYRFFLRGVRHIGGAEQRIERLRPDEELIVRPDPLNASDALAVAIDNRESQALGYVPRCLLDDLHALRKGGSQLHAFVDRRNPPPAPVHERLLCRLAATAIPDFVPFASASYQPVSLEATQLTITRQELVTSD